MTTAITKTVSILRISSDRQEHLEDTVVTESFLTIMLNGEELVTLLCSPQHLDYLAIGFLASEGLIQGKEDIKKISVDEIRGIVQAETAAGPATASRAVSKHLVTSGCGRSTALYGKDVTSLAKVSSTTTVSAGEVFTLMKKFQQRCSTFKKTGGVHAAALCDRNGILVFYEDIGRHNAIDKVIGQCVLEDMATQDKLLLTSGRISSEVVLKAVRRNIPLLVSKAPPTSLAATLAKDFNITLIGFVRGQRMNIYANEWRVIDNERPGH